MTHKYLISIVLIIIGIVIFSLAAGFKSDPKGHPEPASLAGALARQIEGSQQIISQIENNYMNKVIIGRQEIKVELADSGSKRAQGLSGRDPLPAGTGMLFIFDQPGVYSFWMNKMKFAIDIIWIHEDKVVAIWANAPIPDESGIARYNPETEALYVLEVNAGLVEEKGLKVGDAVTVDLN